MKYLPMNVKKIFFSAFLLSIFFGAQAQTPAASESGNEDRSYIADFAQKSPTFGIIEDRQRPLNFLRTETVSGVKNFVFSYTDAPGELYFPRTSEKKYYVIHSASYRSAMDSFSKENFEDAIPLMRDAVYPYVQFLDLPEIQSLSIHADFDKFVDCLVAANKVKEAAALSATVPYSDSGNTVCLAGVKLARMFVANKMFAASDAIISKLPINQNNMELLTAFFDLLGDMRKSGKTREASLWYTKISNMDTPLKTSAKVWMVYCDILLGNINSAKVYLDQLPTVKVEEPKAEAAPAADSSTPATPALPPIPEAAPAASASKPAAEYIKRDDAIFSLIQMVRGIFKENDNKTEEALNLFAEGIVFGDASSDWMTELLYRTGMSYKKLGNFTASNEIFAQLMLFYPNDLFTKKAEKEVVEIKPDAEANK